MEHKGEGGTNCSWSPWNGLQRPEKDRGNWRSDEEWRSSLLKSTRILRKFIETCCHLDRSEKSDVRKGKKNLQSVKR